MTYEKYEMASSTQDLSQIATPTIINKLNIITYTFMVCNMIIPSIKASTWPQPNTSRDHLSGSFIQYLFRSQIFRIGFLQYPLRRMGFSLNSTHSEEWDFNSTYSDEGNLNFVKKPKSEQDFNSTYSDGKREQDFNSTHSEEWDFNKF